MYKYEVLHYTRKGRKVTLHELANHCNISKSYLSLIEKGNRKLSYDLAVKIAKYLECTPDDLFLNDHINAGEDTAVEL